MFKLKGVFLACVAAVLVAGTAGVPAASASFSECPENWVCIWQDHNFEGRILKFKEEGFWQNLTSFEFNDKTSSWANRTGVDAKLAKNINGEGEQLCLQPHSNASMMPVGWNDEASSIRLFTTNTVC